ncbi:MAG: calcium/sodium antiporter [Lutibacter sp.]|jgi:cation:H+ antiporter|uniref:calcium/sodium antiporter n=1 Tax=Lutibacter sp. TaxID=1925666 RepID=UPI00299E05F2|nr:calcium/sodium antiporter [Lutibacter sp.]MDX1830275.1 calcium/sodium antiporter [Lutibacter sp.]
MNLILVAVGLVLLIFGGHWLLKSAVGLSLRLNIPKIIIGMTVVSFATSAPELIVSIKAALENHADIAFGNVIGSNIANLGFVLAITIILSTISVEKSFYRTDWPVMMLSSILLYGFIIYDGALQRYEGVILVIFLIIFLVYLLKFQKTAVVEEFDEDAEYLPVYKIFLYLLIGGVALWGGSELLIKGAVGMAKFYNVSERIIGVTIVSIGTSIPELAASVIAVLRKEKAISLGNLIGSNIFNILAVLGITSIITPIKVVDAGLLTNDIYWMLGIAFIILPLNFLPVKMKLSWKEGIVLLLGYVLFIISTIFFK